MIHELAEFDQKQASLSPIGHVEDYPSSSYNDDPLLYPGVRPDTSFLVNGSNVYGVAAEQNEKGKLDFTLVSQDGNSQSLDVYLLNAGVDTMEDRIPILAYGANMCPASIKEKFSKIGRPDAEIVPTIYGTLHGYDVVWSGGPGLNGNFIANLYKGEETEDTQVAVGVNFLTKEQLLVLHATELAYDLTTIDIAVDGVSVKALVYAGIDDILMKDGKPVAVDAVQSEGRALPVADTRTLLSEILTLPAIQAICEADEHLAGTQTADEYVTTLKSLKSTKGARLARKRAVHTALADLQMSRDYKLPISETGLQSWANPSTIPTFGQQQEGIYHNDVYVLPSTELDIGKWPYEKERNRVVGSMGLHFVRITDGLERKK